MSLKPFNINAYGNPRAKVRHQHNVAVPVPSGELLKPDKTSSTPAVHSGQTLSPTTEQRSSTYVEHKDLNAIQFSNPTTSESSQKPNERVTQATQSLDKTIPSSPSLSASARREESFVKPLKHSKKKPEVAFEAPSFTIPISQQNETAINKLDFEPDHGANGGVSLIPERAHSKLSEKLQTKPKLDTDAQLKQLQDLTLKKIHRQGKNRKISDEKHNTTSLRDLDLARTPINPHKPSTSDRPWARGSPVTEGKEGEEYTSRKEVQSNLSQIPELPASRITDTEPTDTRQKKEEAIRPSRWATKEELKVEEVETDSNAWGSAAPSDATRGTNPSDNRYGRLLNKIPAGQDQETLANWDGKLLPAPADWHDRPRFNNNSASFKQHFEHWLPSYTGNTNKPQRFNNGVPYQIISPEELGDLTKQADGISMVSVYVTIDVSNAAQYGFPTQPENATKYSSPVEERDFTDWGKLDPYDTDNLRHREETSQNLIDNWLRHLAVSRAKAVEVGMGWQSQPVPENTMNESHEDPPDPILIRPVLNIYIRPATKADLPELTRIYNWHIQNTTRPVETQQISEADMRQRLEMADSGSLPFLVAGKKSQKGARAKATDYDDGEAELYRQANLPFKQRRYRGPSRIEQLAGFCCLQEFTAADFVEYISSEMEIYVDSSCFRKGVGQCLIDKMLEICDRSHIRRTMCDFHCDQLIRHNYEPGGARNLHKIYTILRKYHIPKTATISLADRQRVRNNALAKTQLHETDYERWQKTWLEKLGFEVEGVLKKAGAKNGRYLDLIYLARETSWAPLEGQVPEPFTGFAGNNGVEEEEDDNLD